MTIDAGPSDSGLRAPHMQRLEGTSIPELLWQLHESGHTGTLLLERAGVRKALYFRDGHVIFSASTDPEDRLGSLLFRRGELELGALVDAGAEVVRGRRLGQVLIQRGLIEPGALVRAVIDQVREIALSVFSWSSGGYRASRAGLPGRETVTLEMPMEELILAGVRRVRDGVEVRRAVGGSRAVYEAVPGAPSAMSGLGMTERAILEELQQPRRLETLCARVIAPSEVVLRLVWGLAIIGLIARASSRSAVPAAGADAQVREGFLDPEQGASGLLLDLADAGCTGAVRLFRDLHQAVIYLRDGRIDFATTTDPELGLGPHLLRRGVISDQDLDEAARRLITGRRLGVLLAERGALKFQEVGRFVRDQVLEIVKHVVLWTDGEYEIEDGRTLDEAVVLDRTVEDVVVTAYEFLDDCERLWRELGGLSTFYRLRPEYLARLDRIALRPGIWELISLLRRPCSVRELCAARPEPDVDITRWLCGLRQVRVVEKAPAEEIAALGEEACVAWTVPAVLPQTEGVPAGAAAEPPSGKATAAELAPELFPEPAAGAPAPEAPPLPPCEGDAIDRATWPSPSALGLTAAPPPDADAATGAPPGPVPIAPWPPEGAGIAAEGAAPPWSLLAPATPPSESSDEAPPAGLAPAPEVEAHPAVGAEPIVEGTPPEDSETSSPFDLDVPPLIAAPPGESVVVEERTAEDLPREGVSAEPITDAGPDALLEPEAAPPLEAEAAPAPDGAGTIPATARPSFEIAPLAQGWDPAATVRMERAAELGAPTDAAELPTRTEESEATPAPESAVPPETSAWVEPGELPAVETAPPVEAAPLPEITQKVPPELAPSERGWADQPAAAPDSAPAEALPAELLAAVDRFNGRHRVVFEGLRREIGAGVRNFVLTCAHRLGAAGAPFEGLAPDKTGVFDRDALARGVLQRASGDASRLEDLITFELNLVRDLMAPSRLAVIEEALERLS